ncbi:MAG: hypothetical protein AAB332_03245, partial [Planctomycetota bacterium]
KPLAIRMIDKIQADPLTTVIPVTFDRFEKALSLYKKRTDKAWGMIDCFSFIAMDGFGVKRALTFDEHFRQAGYKVPLF